MRGSILFRPCPAALRHLADLGPCDVRLSARVRAGTDPAAAWTKTRQPTCGLRDARQVLAFVANRGAPSRPPHDGRVADAGRGPGRLHFSALKCKPTSSEATDCEVLIDWSAQPSPYELAAAATARAGSCRGPEGCSGGMPRRTRAAPPRRCGWGRSSRPVRPQSRPPPRCWLTAAGLCVRPGPAGGAARTCAPPSRAWRPARRRRRRRACGGDRRPGAARRGACGPRPRERRTRRTPRRSSA